MGKIVVHRSEKLPYGYSKLNNELFCYGLSGNAFLVLLFALSRPVNWDFSVSGTAAILPFSEKTVASALRELKENGFYQVNKSRRKSGQYETRTHIFYDYPSLSNGIKPRGKNKLPVQSPSPKMRDKRGAGKTQQKTSSCPVAKNHIVVSADNKDIYNRKVNNKDIDEDRILNETPKSIDIEISDFLSDLNITKIKKGGDYLH